MTDEDLTDAVTELLWAELDRYLPDGAIHPHAMRAIAYQIVQLMVARIDGQDAPVSDAGTIEP